jgi:hypothetical protein
VLSQVLLATNLESGIDKAFKAGEMTAGEAFAARSLAKVLTSAVKALGNPDDPNYGFASAFINDLMPAPEQNPAHGPVTQTAFDDDGHLMPGIVNPQASPEQQRTQLAHQLHSQGMPLVVAHLMAQQALGGDVATPAPTSAAPLPTANAPSDAGNVSDQRITITGRALPQDAYGNRYELTPEGHVVVYQQGGGLVRVDARQAQASGLAATLLSAGARMGAGAAPTAVSAIALPELGALLLRALVTGAGVATLLVIPGNNSAPITTTLGRDERFVQLQGELWGQLQTRDPVSGEWTSQRAQGIRNGTNFEVLTADQLARLQRPLTTPITPPQPSGPPPLPAWVDNNRPNPGYTAAPAGPTTIVTPAAPQPTAADLILTRNRDNNRTQAQDRYRANPELRNPAALAGTQGAGGVGKWGYPDTPRSSGGGTDYQEQLQGVPYGLELNVGGQVDAQGNISGGAWMDGSEVRNGQVYVIDRKDWSKGFVDFMQSADRFADAIESEAMRQADAVSGTGAKIEWQVTTEYAAAAIRVELIKSPLTSSVEVVVVPKK